MVLKKKSLKVAKKAVTRVSKAAVAHTKKAASALKLRKRGTNMSRKQIMVLQRDKYHDKQLKKQEKEIVAKEKVSKGFQHAMNKKVHKPFDHAELRVVHDGLVAGIEALGEPVTPTALLMVAMTTLGKWQDKKQAPYLLVICTACFPKVSPALLNRMFPQLLRLCEQCISESEQNSLLAAKAMKLIQQVFSCLEPSMQLYNAVRKLEPNRLNTIVMPLYLTTLRKVLQSAALTEGRATFFLQALPDFVSLCLTSFTDAPQNVVSASFGELQTLFSMSISPQIVESNNGHSVINGIISDKLTQMFKPHTQRHWGLAAELVGSLFERLCYLKRTANANKFLAWFNTVPFLLKVLNKIRHVDDTSLNTSIEKAMIAIGKGMSVESFVTTLPFNPMDIAKIRTSGQDEDSLWKNSYLVNLVRRIAAHDSLPFFVRYFGPIIEFCRNQEKESLAANREAEALQWGSLHSQYWRVCVGFFHYPITVTSDAYREVAKQLVALLSTNLVDVAANAFHVLCSGYHKLATTEQDNDLEDSDDDYQEEAGAFAPHRQSNKTNLEDDDTFLRMNDEGWNVHAFHGITQAAAQEVCAILAKYSTNIMPRLCNVFKTHDSSAVLNGIQSYSRVCTPSVMQTILKSILDVGETIGEAEGENNAQVTSHRRVVLDIACAICAQLSVEHLHKVFETIVEPVLSDPSPNSRILQKKAYKLLYAMFEHRIKDMYPLFARVMGLLAVGQQHVTVSGLKMRIRCVSWALDACKMYYPDSIVPAIKSAVGEVVLFSRERSSGARDMAMEVLDKMQRYMVAAGCSHNTLLHIVLAGLSGKTGMLVSCTVVCLAKLVYMSFESLSHGDLEGTVSMCFQLMESAIPEIRTAAATFARMVLKLMKRSVPVANAVRGALPKILMAIALVTSQTRVSSSVRVMMRVLLEKCIKRFGFDSVDSLFPLGSKRFLIYTNKMLRREEKKEEREMKKRAEAQKNEFSDLFLGAMKANNGGEDGDLLEGGALTQFVATRSALPFNGNRGDDDDAEDDMCLVMESDKIRIMSKLEKKREDDYRKNKMIADRLLRRAGGVMNPRQMATSDEHQEKRKRGRDDGDNATAQDLENDELVLRYGDKINESSVKAAASQFNRGRVEGDASAGARPGARPGAPSSHTVKLRDQKQQRKELARERVQEDIRLGDEFSSGKGQGDVKRGSLDPFAYVPLNRRFMNKRHSRQAVQRFEAVSTKTFKGNKAKMVYGK